MGVSWQGAGRSGSVVGGDMPGLGSAALCRPAVWDSVREGDPRVLAGSAGAPVSAVLSSPLGRLWGSLGSPGACRLPPAPLAGRPGCSGASAPREGSGEGRGRWRLRARRVRGVRLSRRGRCGVGDGDGDGDAAARSLQARSQARLRPGAARAQATGAGNGREGRGLAGRRR